MGRLRRPVVTSLTDEIFPHLLQRAAIALVAFVGIVLFIIRLAGPFDLLDKDQQNPTAYIVDAVQNGNWICQRDAFGRITSKPPLYTWIAAFASLPFGRVNRFTVTLPAALSTLAIGVILFVAGRKHFGWSAGLLAALTWFCSPTAAKLIGLIRTDGLFSLTILIAALMAFRAWQLGRGWTWFWLAAAAATLTKGPLGVALAAGGLLAVLWEWRTGRSTPLRGSHWPGVALFLLLGAGWFALAWLQVGREVSDKMIGEELVTQIVPGQTFRHSFENFFKPTIYLLSRFAPWSLFACIALWRAWRRPVADDASRQLERFLMCWILFGLLIFTAASHKRADLLFPLVPPMALLVGRELARLLRALKPMVLLGVSAASAAVGLIASLITYDITAWREPRVMDTLGMEELAGSVRAKVGENFPLTHVMCPLEKVDQLYAPQFFLNTMRQTVSYEQAAGLLRGDAAAFVVVSNPALLQSLLGPNYPALRELARWPTSGKPLLHIISNHPKLEWTRLMAMSLGPLQLRMDGLRLIRTWRGELIFEGDSNGSVTLFNQSNKPQLVRMRIRTLSSGGTTETRELLAGESWQAKAARN